MAENWLERQFQSLQKRYAIAAGIFGSSFLLSCANALQEKQPLIIPCITGYAISQVIGVVWRHAINQEILKELVKRVPEDARHTDRCKKIFRYITYHERGLWVGWSNALGYALILTLIPIFPLMLLAGFLVYALWHYYQLKEATEFVGRMEIHGWAKLGSLSHDPFLKEIDQKTLRRGPTRRFLYGIDMNRKQSYSETDETRPVWLASYHPSLRAGCLDISISIQSPLNEGTFFIKTQTPTKRICHVVHHPA